MASPPMTTSIQSLPNNTTVTTSLVDEDPMVKEVLDEMEQQMQRSQGPMHPGSQVPSGPYPSSTIVMPIRTAQPVYYQPQQYTLQQVSAPWWNVETAQRAALAAAIAFAIFHPSILASIYKTSTTAARFESYDSYIRTALLAVILYAIMWKLEM